ncbi:hypothetical protein NADE_002305 [Nannochloris sp. 'desiccata']|nr:hypothetical protein NADE_002305 [Chlorella desiccata (nom. nud.)]
MSNKRPSTDGQSGNPSNIRLNDVSPIWLEASSTERYLLLEDTETGDILMPLIYMKHVLVANYSRKLAALKNRLVTIPVAGPLADQQGLLYWQWAFESPHAVKVIVRQEIGDATPQGHLRLVLIPIVYNALVAQEDLRSSPLFHALHRAMRSSTYWPLLLPIEDGLLPTLDAAAGITGPLPDPLFCGPRLLEATAIKYMFMFKDKEEMVASKRNRTTGASNIDNGVLTAAIMGSGLTQTTNLMALVPSAGAAQRPGADTASMEAAAAAAMASAAAMAAAAVAAAAAAKVDEDDEDIDNCEAGNDGGGDDYDGDGNMGGGGGGGGDNSLQQSLDAAAGMNNGPMPLQDNGTENNDNNNTNGGQVSGLPSIQASDINFHAQMVEAMMQQQLQLQQRQQQQQLQQLPPLPPGLQLPQQQQQQQPMAVAMKQNALQQHYPPQMQMNNPVSHTDSFASLMRAAAGNTTKNNNDGTGAPIIQHPGLQTSINVADVHTADTVRQLVDMKFQELVRELMRLKSSMMQLYTAVVGVALTQGSVPSELLGAGGYMSAPMNANGLNGIVSNDMSNTFNRALGGGNGGVMGIEARGAHQNQPPPLQQQRIRSGAGVAQHDLIHQAPVWPPLYGEIQQAGGLKAPPQQQVGNINGGGGGGTQLAQEELNLAALKKNTTTNNGGTIQASVLPDLGGSLLQGGGGGSALPGSQQQQQQHGNMNASPGAQHAAAWANAIGMGFPQQQGMNNNNNTGQQ